MSGREARSAMSAVMFTRKEARVKERELLRVAAELPGAESAAAASHARNQVLSWATQQIGDQLPAAALAGQSFEYLRGGRTCLGASFEDSRRIFWAVRVDRPDATVAQRTWTTEVVIGRGQSPGASLFCLRLLVSTPEVYLPIEPAVPGLVRKVATVCGLSCGGLRIDGLTWSINSQSDAEELVAELISPDRAIPYLVCSIAEGEEAPRIDVRLLAKATYGIAKVVVVPPAFTWVLTERLGRLRSVYNGAVRLFFPGFSRDAKANTHRLFLIGGGENEGQSRSVVSLLRWIVANESLRRWRLDEDVVAFSAVRELSLDFERQRLKQVGSSDAEQLRAAQAQVEALKDDLMHSKYETEQWLREFEREEAESNGYQQQLRAANYRIRQLLDQIKGRGDEPDSAVVLPERWGDFADWCDEVLDGRVILSGRALREIKSAEYDDPKAAARCLLWLANEYRDSRISGSVGDLRKPIFEGVHNDRCGSDSFDFGWDGRNVLVEWHVKNGGNTRDPKRCLRIYYFGSSRNRVGLQPLPAA